MHIYIDTIPHSSQRYDTCGDWFLWKDRLDVRVSKLDDEDYEFLIGIHETIEAYLCKRRSIKEQDVTNFDIKFGEEGRDGEPGDAPDAPYRKEHFFATSIERLIAAELGVDWELYDAAVNNL